MSEWITPSDEECDASFERATGAAMGALGDLTDVTEKTAAMRICDALAAAKAVKDTDTQSFTNGRQFVHGFYYECMPAVAEALVSRAELPACVLMAFARVAVMLEAYASIELMAEDEASFIERLNDKVKAWFLK